MPQVSTIAIALGVFFLTDVIATYIYVKHLIRKYPKIDAKQFELNPIIRWVWSKIGVDWGTFLAPVFLSPFYFAVVICSLAKPEFFWGIVGMYMVILVLHLANFEAWLSKEKLPFEILYDKVYGFKEDKNIAYELFGRNGKC